MKECKGRDAGARSKRTRRDAPLPNDWQPPTAPQALERFTSLPQGRGGIRALPGRSPNFGEAQAAMRLAMQGGRGQQARGRRGCRGRAGRPNGRKGKRKEERTARRFASAHQSTILSSQSFAASQKPWFAQ